MRIKSKKFAVAGRPDTMQRVNQISEEYNMTRSAVAEIAFRCFFEQVDSVLNRDEFIAFWRNYVSVASDGRLVRIEPKVETG